MLKRIPKSDISIRPFKAYKEWDKETSNLSIFSAEDGNYASTDETTSSVGYLTGSSYNKHSIYGQLRAQFYNGYEDNPFIRFGSKKPIYSKQVNTNERYLSGSAVVISIPQNKIGAASRVPVAISVPVANNRTVAGINNPTTNKDSPKLINKTTRPAQD